MLKDYDISLTVRCEENPNKWIVDALYDNLEQRRNEDILLKSYSYAEVKKKMENKEILNGMALIGLQWFFLNIEQS